MSASCGRERTKCEVGYTICCMSVTYAKEIEQVRNQRRPTLSTHRNDASRPRTAVIVPMTQEPCCCREIGERGANVTSARQRTCHRIGIHQSRCMHVSRRLVQPCTYAAAFQPSSRSNVRRIKMPASDPEAARSETAPSWIRGPALSRALRCIEALAWVFCAIAPAIA